MAEKKLTFEQALSRLDIIVAQLERGEAPLEDALKLFEEGNALVRQCSGMLDRAEQTVTRLTQSPDGTPQEAPFEEGG